MNKELEKNTIISISIIQHFLDKATFDFAEKFIANQRILQKYLDFTKHNKNVRGT